MLNVSFYLLTPTSKSQTQVYVSISSQYKRLRFATGESFIASYCNVRKTKGSKELVKRNTVFYFEYTSKLNEIRDTLIRIDMDLSKDGNKPDLSVIRDAYYLKTGKIQPEPELTFDIAYNRFIDFSKSGWTDNTHKKFTGTLNHLKEFEEKTGHGLSLKNMSVDTWNSFRDDYFVTIKKASNPTTNKILEAFKQFLKFCIKRGFIQHAIDFDDLNYLKEIEPFKVALKEDEVEVLANLVLIPRLERVRDLFMLEILTGQRFSDLPKLMDVNHIYDTNIIIYQEKTNEKAVIPLHPKLKKHLTKIFSKYPVGLPTISNQKFNAYLKEICVIAKFNRKHTWTVLIGKRKELRTDFRHNLITSHTGRRTFCTLALKNGIKAEMIMKVTGHRKYEQFREYVKVDDEDLTEVFEGMFVKN